MLAFREANRLNQAEAAAPVGISQEMWSLLERGKAFASPAVAERIAALIGCDFRLLLNYSVDKSSGVPPEDGADSTGNIKSLP